MKSRDQNYMERKKYFAKNHCTRVRGRRTRRCFVLRCFRWTGKQWFMENTFCVIFLCATVFSRPHPSPHRPFFFIRPSQNNTTTTAAFLFSWFLSTYEYTCWLLYTPSWDNNGSRTMAKDTLPCACWRGMTATDKDERLARGFRYVWRCKWERVSRREHVYWTNSS